MTKGYAIFTEEITDHVAMGPYAQAAMLTILAAGSAPIIASPPDEVVEGDWHGNQTVVVEFPLVEVPSG